MTYLFLETDFDALIPIALVAIFIIGLIINATVLKPFWEKILPTNHPNSYEEMVWRDVAWKSKMRKGQLVIRCEDISEIYNLTDMNVSNNWVHLVYNAKAKVENGQVSDQQLRNGEFDLEATANPVISHKEIVKAKFLSYKGEVSILPKGHPDIVKIPIEAK
jgi:hypothetical protein